MEHWKLSWDKTQTHSAWEWCQEEIIPSKDVREDVKQCSLPKVAQIFLSPSMIQGLM